MQINKTLTKPKAVSNNLVEQEFGDELLVYNLENHRAMSLNITLATIWKLCDGKRNLNELERLTEFKLNSLLSEDIILLALDELQRNNLIIFDKTGQIENLSQLNRRNLIKKIGLSTTLAIPVITGLIAPKAISAASLTCKAVNVACTQNSDCCSDCCAFNACTQANLGGVPDGGFCNVDADCASNCCDTNICAPACGTCFI